MGERERERVWSEWLKIASNEMSWIEISRRKRRTVGVRVSVRVR